MATKRVEIRVVDNGYVIIWDDVISGATTSHEEIVDTKVNLRNKLTALFTD